MHKKKALKAGLTVAVGIGGFSPISSAARRCTCE